MNKTEHVNSNTETNDQHNIP